MSDFEQANRQPTEEELREYLVQLRAADPAEFLAQAFNILATGAQAKLGLTDGRLLIDAMGGLVDAVADRLPNEIAEPMRNGVVQLKTAHVQAERELAERPEGVRAAGGAAGQGAGSGDGGNGAPATGAAGGGGAGGPGGAGGGQAEQKMTDRLWIPGRQPPGA